MTVDKIAGHVKAYIDQASSIETGGQNLVIAATDNSIVTADALAAVISASFSDGSNVLSLSIRLALAFDT